MAYLGLARKWRPQKFEDLVGQGHIARTIQNAIKADRVSQGYLFTGTRGIGKTSSARIFAKALRCQNTKEPGIPCNTCNDCNEISEGRSVDVLEIDGASNNGVDAVREIRENAKYLPSSGKYKIYIIDEVHMLTTAAFNALLKTLEEPPAHVVFVFATTDPQKIPATVLSRTQRFDFKRVSEKELKDRLKFISDAEKAEITPEALNILAREAEGSMRDGVSLLDQVFAASNGKITAEVVTNSLGLVDKQTILDCVTGILKRQPLNALDAVGRVHLHGFDLKQFGREILRMLRQVMVVKLLEEKGQTNLSTFLDVSDVDINDLRKLSSERSIDDLDMLFRLMNHGLEDIARSTIPKMVMDVLLVKMAAIESLVNLSDLSGPITAPTSGIAPTTTATVISSQHSQSAAPAAIAATPTPVKAAAAPEKPRNAYAAEIQAMLSSTPARKSNLPTRTSGAAQKEKLDTPQAASPAAMAASAKAAGPAPTDSQSMLDWWTRAVSFVKAQKPLVGSVLEHLGIEQIHDDNGLQVITLNYTKDRSFYKDQLQSRAYNDLVLQMLKNYLGRAVRLEYKEVLSSSSALNDLEQERTRKSVEERKRTVLESEALKATQQLLGARLEKLELNDEAGF